MYPFKFLFYPFLSKLIWLLTAGIILTSVPSLFSNKFNTIGVRYSCIQSVSNLMKIFWSPRFKYVMQSSSSQVKHRRILNYNILHMRYVRRIWRRLQWHGAINGLITLLPILMLKIIIVSGFIIILIDYCNRCKNYYSKDWRSFWPVVKYVLPKNVLKLIST